MPYWFLPPTPTPPNAEIINTRSSQNTYPGVHIQSPGLLQLTALPCVRQSYPESSVHPECRCSASHWSRTTRPYFAGFAAVAPAASSTGCQFRDALTTYKLTCFVFSSLSGHAPPYLADDIHLVSEGHRRRLRSSTDRSCAVRSTHTQHIRRQELHCRRATCLEQSSGPLARRGHYIRQFQACTQNVSF